MEIIKSLSVENGFGTKRISVLRGDISELKERLDVLTVSAFIGNYDPIQRTMIGALYSKGISVQNLAYDPAIDLRKQCRIWLSNGIDNARIPIGRIGCIELQSLTDAQHNSHIDDRFILNTIKSYFSMLDIASNSGIEIQSLALPLLGSGSQKLPVDLVMIPMISESLRFLERNEDIRDIYFIAHSAEKAEMIAAQLERSYSVTHNAIVSAESVRHLRERPLAFISYSGRDKLIADNLCSKLESRGIRVWYAPRDVDHTDYASAIVNAITRCTHFCVILSKDSLASEHVLNEIDLAFSEVPRGIRFYPLKLDQEALGPAFKYYLSRQHWMDASCPPLEKRLEEYVDKIKTELS